MNQEIKTGPCQFGIAVLLALTSCIGVFCALAMWVVQSNALGTLDDIPVPVVPSIPFMGFGLFAVPIICLLLVLAILFLVLRSKPRPFTVLIFFGFVAMAIFMSSGWWDNSLRLLAAMVFSTIAMLFETLLRNLPRSQIAAAALSTAVSFGYYIFLLSAVVSASV